MAVDFLVAAKTEAGVVNVMSAEDVLIAPFNMTPYGAAYVALAEALALPLYTRDGRLSRSVRHQADIRLV